MKNFGGSKRSERSKDFSKKRGNDYGKPSMHQTTCDSCGRSCEVPFKPTSGKPIFCSNCFEKNQDDAPKKYGRDREDRRDRGDRKFKSSDSRKRIYDDRDSVMHEATCDSCGDDCEVPFKPTKGKPIYCDNCFENNKGKDTNQLREEFEILNNKLDRILEILLPPRSVKFDHDDEEMDDPKPKKRLKKTE